MRNKHPRNSRAADKAMNSRHFMDILPLAEDHTAPV